MTEASELAELVGHFEVLEGGVGAVPGVRTVATACGLKGDDALDLGVLRMEAPAVAAGVFTRNQAAAAPVQLCRERLAADRSVRTIVVNSGNANALTGESGRADALAVLKLTESLFGGPALPLSTGVIGVPLPRSKLLSGLQACAGRLQPDSDAFARAMLTTDTCTKQAARRVRIAGEWITVGGVAKGSGMIHPDMATMLAVIATDAVVSSPALDRLLREVTEETFNRISVDGDTSTNDSVIALARRGDDPLDGNASSWTLFGEAVRQVAASLADQIVADGEGATKVLELTVCGARWPGDARQIARAVATSVLVKTALHGGDPNWGRIISAAGTAGVPLDLDALELRVGDALVFGGGRPREEAQEAAARAFAQERVEVELRIGLGEEHVTVLTSDLSADYVAINAHYRT